MSGIADHLWQSTWFALAACTLAVLVRRDRARIRYWVWFAASVKFLVPFASLTWVGNHFILQLQEQPTLLPLVRQVTAPLADGTISVGRFDATAQYAFFVIWLLGSAAVLGRWASAWVRGRTLVRTSTPCDIAAPIAVRCTERLSEPAVVGIIEPVVLLPRYVLQSFTPAEVATIIAHELWHVRRRDNLVAALHGIAQVLFWFHPLVWWIGAKLVQEREYACDEEVIRDGHDQLDYAATLLRVCRQSMSARLLCAASVADGDLTARVRAIVCQGVPSRSAIAGRIALCAALLGCIGTPVASGMMVVATSELSVAAGARSIQLSRPADPSFTVLHEDYVYARNVSLRELLAETYAVHPREVRSDSRALDFPRYDIALRAPPGGSDDPRQLVSQLLDEHFNLELVVRTTR